MTEKSRFNCIYIAVKTFWFCDCTNCTVLNLKENFWQEKRKSQKKKVGDYFLAYIMSAPSLICLAFFFSSFTSRENQMCFLNSVDAAGLISRSFLESPTTNLDYWTHPSSPHPRETLYWSDQNGVICVFYPYYFPFEPFFRRLQRQNIVPESIFWSVINYAYFNEKSNLVTLLVKSLYIGENDSFLHQ